MSSNAIGAFGTLLKIGDGGGPETFTTIAEVLDISGPEFELRTEEVTHHQSPGGWAEYIGTIKDGNEVTFDINYQPTHATHNESTGLLADLINRVKRNFQLVLPDAGTTTISFTALVTNFPISEPVAGVLRTSVTMKITGQPTIA
jgi:hypothetical protein